MGTQKILMNPKCPKCKNDYVLITYIDKEGFHWRCPSCGATNERPPLSYDNKTK